MERNSKKMKDLKDYIASALRQIDQDFFGYYPEWLLPEMLGGILIDQGFKVIMKKKSENQSMTLIPFILVEDVIIISHVHHSEKMKLHKMTKHRNINGMKKLFELEESGCVITAYRSNFYGTKQHAI